MNRLSYLLWLPLAGIGLIPPVAGAQNRLPDSSRTFAPSTVLKTQPMAALMGNLNLAVEQTVSKRISVELEVNRFIPIWPVLRVIGQSQGLAASVRYYPLASQTAPRGIYVGAKLSYSQLQNSEWLRLISLLTTASNTTNASAWLGQGLIGYQYGTRRNLILNIQGGANFLYRINYYETGSSGQQPVERHTDVGQIIPSVTLSIGYRFRHRTLRPQKYKRPARG